MIHDRLCINFSGPCCEWLGDCDCQCLCEFINEIRNDERERAAQRMCDSWNAGPDLFSRLIDAVRGES